MKKRAMKKSIIARGKRAKSSVFRGTKVKTVSGLKKSDLVKNKSGKVVSKKASARGQKNKWAAAFKKARKDLGIRGFCPCGGKRPRARHFWLKPARTTKK